MVQKGKRQERELANRLLENGWYAQRTGASGAATTSARPDITALWNTGDATVGMVIELKSWSEGTGRLVNDECEQLQEVAERSGLDAKLGVWPDRRKKKFDSVYLFPLEELHENKKSKSVRQTHFVPEFEFETVTEEYESL